MCQDSLGFCSINFTIIWNSPTVPLAGPMTLTGHIVSQADRRASAGISHYHISAQKELKIRGRYIWGEDLFVDLVRLKILNMIYYIDLLI